MPLNYTPSLKRFNPIYLLIPIFWMQILSVYAAVPAGYYSTATGTGAILKTQLYNIISGHTAKSYDYLWTAFATTDARSDGKVWDMYSDQPGGTPTYLFTFGDNQCGTYNSEADCYNREHSFPASWFNDAAPMYTDLFHLVPTDGYVNNQRGSYPFGEVGTATFMSSNGSKVGTSVTSGDTVTVFEPIDEYKGDFARSYFYMATRYENLIAGWYANSTEANAVLQNNNFPVYETWFLNMLAEWHVQDPVSAKETARNDAVYAIQGNRNPYIDHPEYVYQIWGVGEIDEPIPLTPIINIEQAVSNGSILDFGIVSSSTSKSIFVKTSTLNGDLIISLTGSAFKSSLSTISREAAEVGQKISLTFNPDTTGNYTNTFTISGGGLTSSYSVTLVGKNNN